ncbi:MAG: glycosyltransferase [Pirellulales bacterium]
MSSFVFLALSILLAAALVQAVLFTLQSWEHRRFVRSRLRESAQLKTACGRVALMAPCKGLDVGLEENLRRLLEQDYENYEVTFVVANAEDPACWTIRRLMAQYPRERSRLIVAGPVVQGGQKVHNLLAATADLDDDIEILAFVDSDARPELHWLRALVGRLAKPETGVATGYRWFVPARPSLANYLLYGINGSIATLFRSTRQDLIWGGSWAIRRQVFESIGLRKAWEGTLSDDLVASRVLHQAGLRVEFEPACMVASPLDNNLRQMMAFVRRQYTIARYYTPGRWIFGLATAAVSNLGFWGGLGLAAFGAVTGAAWTWLPLAGCGLFYGLRTFQGMLRRDVARTYLPAAKDALAGAARFDAWAGPLVVLANGLGLVASAFGRHVRWRGLCYRLYAGGQARLVRGRSTSFGSGAFRPHFSHLPEQSPDHEGASPRA